MSPRHHLLLTLLIAILTAGLSAAPASAEDQTAGGDPIVCVKNPTADTYVCVNTPD